MELRVQDSTYIYIEPLPVIANHTRPLTFRYYFLCPSRIFVLGGLLNFKRWSGLLRGVILWREFPCKSERPQLAWWFVYEAVLKMSGSELIVRWPVMVELCGFPTSSCKLFPPLWRAFRSQLLQKDALIQDLSNPPFCNSQGPAPCAPATGHNYE